MAMSLIVDEHRQFLADRSRVQALRHAIAETVKPGDVVLDLGSGTGILGMLACEAGARRVYSVEQGGMIGLARQVAQANFFDDRIVFIKGLSTRVELPEKVDVAVCDQMGRFGFEAGVIEFFNDARARFLKAAGNLIPRKIEMFLAPVECQTIWNQIEFWNHLPAGFNFSPARTWAANTAYPIKLEPSQLLGEPGMLCSIDLSHDTPQMLSGTTTLQITRPGTLHGMGGWFSAQLSQNVTMSNSPLIPEPIRRRNVFLPFDHSVAVNKGDSLRIRIHIAPADVLLTWDVEVMRASASGENVAKERFRHSTLSGMLLCKEDLERMRPQFIPQLSSWGKARRSILELCNGNISLAQIEEEVYRRHSNLFSSLGEAASFVSEVITLYSI